MNNKIKHSAYRSFIDLHFFAKHKHIIPMSKCYQIVVQIVSQGMVHSLFLSFCLIIFTAVEMNKIWLCVLIGFMLIFVSFSSSVSSIFSYAQNFPK